MGMEQRRPQPCTSALNRPRGNSGPSGVAQAKRQEMEATGLHHHTTAAAAATAERGAEERRRIAGGESKRREAMPLHKHTAAAERCGGEALPLVAMHAWW